MSTQQATLSGELLEPPGSPETRACPLCGKPGIPKSQLPRHISSDDCQTDAKTIHYK